MDKEFIENFGGNLLESSHLEDRRRWNVGGSGSIIPNGRLWYLLLALKT